MTQLDNDTYNRTVTGGWGTSTDGHVWTHALGSGTLGVSSGHGTLKASGSGTFDSMYIPGTYKDASVLVCFSFGTDFAEEVSIVFRGDSAGNNRYRVGMVGYDNQFSFRKTVAGTETNVKNVAWTPPGSGTYYIRATLSGSNLYAKFWSQGTAEPTAWNIAVSDTSLTGANSVGIFAGASTTTTQQYYSFYAVDYVYADVPVSVSESLLVGVKAVQTESVTIGAEGTAYVTTFVPTEVLTTTDTSSMQSIAQGYAFLDNLTTDDSASLFTSVFVPSDLVSLLDSQSQAYVYNATDTVNGIESLNSTPAITLPYDFVTLSDAAFYVSLSANTDQLSIVETMFLRLSATYSDIALAANETYRTTCITLAVDIVLSGNERMDIGLAFQEMVSVQEIIALSWSIGFVETAMQLSELVLLTGTMLDLSLLALQETFQEGLAYSSVETTTVQESGTTTVAFSATEQALVNEMAATVVLVSYTDQLIEQEQFGLGLQLQQLDAGQVSDLLLSGASVITADVLATQDLSWFISGTQAVDQASSTDKLMASVLLAQADVLSTVDQSTTLLAYVVLAEGVTIADSAAYAITTMVGDSLATSDSVFLLFSTFFVENPLVTQDGSSVQLLQTWNDTLSAVEQLRSTALVAAQDSVILTDIQTASITTLMLDLLAVQENMALAVSSFFTDTNSAVEVSSTTLNQNGRDSVTGQEGVTYGVSTSYLDGALLPVDAATTFLTLYASDTASLADYYTLLVRQQGTDSVVPSDALSNAFALLLMDAVQAQDGVVTTTALASLDALAATDATVFQLLARATEQLLLTEQSGYVIILADSTILSVQDALSAVASQRNYTMAGFDQLNQTEVPIFVVAYGANPDQIAVSDTIQTLEYAYKIVYAQVRGGKVAGNVRTGVVSGMVRSETIQGDL